MKTLWYSAFTICILFFAGCASNTTSGNSLSTPGNSQISVSLSPNSVMMAKGSSQPFTATVSGTPNTAVVWNATAGTITGTGPTITYTAPSTTGNSKLTATSLADSTQAASATITVVNNVADGIGISSSHPLLWFNATRLSAAKTWFLNNPFTPNTTDYMGMALYDLLSGTATYTAQVVNWVTTYNMPLTGIACDQCRWNGESLIVIFDWEYPNLTPGQKSTLLMNYDQWIDYWQQQSWGGPTMPQNNYFWGYLRNECEWGLVSYNDQPSQATTYLDDCLMTRWASAFLPTTVSSGNAVGGLPQEGDEYGRYMLWYPLIPFVTASLNGRNLYGETNFFEGAVFNLIYSTSQEQVTKVGGAGTGQRHWELFPFSDDETFINGGSAEARFSNIDGNGSYTGDFMNVMANSYSSLPLGGYARQWLNNLALPTANHVAAVDNSGSIAPLPFSSLPLDYYDAGIQYLYGHSAWGGSGTTDFMLQMGAPSGAGHFHSDYGTWQLRRNGPSSAYWLSRETVGYSEAYTPYGDPQPWTSSTAFSVNARVLPSPPNGYAYQQVASPTCISGGSQPNWPATPLATVNDGSCIWLNNSNGLNGDRVFVTDLTLHNGILMNGLGLAYGGKDGLPIVQRLESQSEYSYADVDLTSSYRNTTNSAHPERDNPAAAHVEREFLFIRPLETLVIFDRLTSNGVGNLPATAITKTFLAHCEVNWTLEDATHADCNNGDQNLRISTLEPTSFSRRVVNESNCPSAQQPCNTDGQFRLELDASGSAQTYFLNVLQAKDLAGPDVMATVVDNGSSYTVTLSNGSINVTVVFNQGPTSTSGSITINGLTTNLRTDVEQMTIANSAPTWY